VLLRSSFPEGRQHLAQEHSSLAAYRTDIEGLSGEGFVARFPVEDSGIRLGGRSIEKLAAECKPAAAVTISQKAEVTDLGETLGKNVKQEAADEFVCLQSHGADAVVMFAVSPLERDFAVLKCQQAMVGNGDAVRIAAEVVKDLSGSSEGRFCVDHPFMFAVSA
jgi:hypothetical protein